MRQIFKRFYNVRAYFNVKNGVFYKNDQRLQADMTILYRAEHITVFILFSFLNNVALFLTFIIHDIALIVIIFKHCQQESNSLIFLFIH